MVMSVGCLVLVFTSIVDTLKPSDWVTEAVFAFVVTAILSCIDPTGMSVRCLVVVFTCFVVIVFTEVVGSVTGLELVTRAVLPSGVIATPFGFAPTAMSVGCLVLVFTSIVDTVPLRLLVTKAVLPPGVIAASSGEEPTGE